MRGCAGETRFKAGTDAQHGHPYHRRGGARILISNPFGIGDVLFTLPLAHALREIHPDGFLGYLCNRRTEELVRTWPTLDAVFVFEKDEFRREWSRSRRGGLLMLKQLISDVRRGRFDVMLDLSLGWQHPLAGWLAGIPRRVGFDFRGRGRFLTDGVPLSGFHVQPVAEYYLDLLSVAGIRRRAARGGAGGEASAAAPAAPPEIIGGARTDGGECPPATGPVAGAELQLPPQADTQADRLLQASGVPNGARLFAIIPGGGTSWGSNAIFKQWPPERFREVAARLIERYRGFILLLGDTQEQRLCRRVAEGLPSECVRVLDTPSLLTLAGLLKRCALVVGNDGGAMHLAAAVGSRTVTLFGPVDGSVYGPFPRRTTHRIVVHGLACRPCYHSFRFPPCPWENACLRQLPVSRVMEAVAELIPS